MMDFMAEIFKNGDIHHPGCIVPTVCRTKQETKRKSAAGKKTDGEERDDK